MTVCLTFATNSRRCSNSCTRNLIGSICTVSVIPVTRESKSREYILRCTNLTLCTLKDGRVKCKFTYEWICISRKIYSLTVLFNLYDYRYTFVCNVKCCKVNSCSCSSNLYIRTVYININNLIIRNCIKCNLAVLYSISLICNIKSKLTNLNCLTNICSKELNLPLRSRERNINSLFGYNSTDYYVVLTCTNLVLCSLNIYLRISVSCSCKSRNRSRNLRS